MSQTRVWESMAAFLAELDGYEYVSSRQRGPRDEWSGGKSYAESVKLATEGDESLVAEAFDALSLIESTSDLQPKRGWVRHVQGARVHVPSYVANSPACFSRRIKRERDVRHVRIFVNIGCGAGVDAHDMLKRGMTILGLVEALQTAQVHVEAYMTIDGIGCGGPHAGTPICHAVKLDDPLNLSVQGFALAHPSMFRRIGMSATEKFAHTTPHGGILYPSKDHQVRKAYDMGPEDVYVPWAAYRDELVSNPQAWIKARLSQLLKSEEY